MGFVLGLLTFILVVNCLVLVLLILIQLPKKEAGVGTAFGGSATDALFGAGTGNALTKLTKYSAAVFFVLALVLSIFNASQAHRGSNRLQEELQKQANQPVQTTGSSAVRPAAAPIGSNLLESITRAAGSNGAANVATKPNASLPASNAPARPVAAPAPAK
ncbi:MAG: preprotein translocase subunit SecG [Candidatus Omnitrophica bacterium]|nr:preprotein translocase subunit SecG [Candidatus Omnitrophota bacterium]